VTEREPSRRKVARVARRLMAFENCFAFHSLTIPETPTASDFKRRAARSSLTAIVVVIRHDLSYDRTLNDVNRRKERRFSRTNRTIRVDLRPRISDASANHSTSCSKQRRRSRARLSIARSSRKVAEHSRARVVDLETSVIKQENVNHRARAFNGLILARAGVGYEKIFVPLFDPCCWPSLQRPRLININLIDSGRWAPREQQPAADERKEREEGRESAGGGGYRGGKRTGKKCRAAE